MYVRPSLYCSVLYRQKPWGRCPVQGVLPKLLKEFVASEINYESKEAKSVERALKT